MHKNVLVIGGAGYIGSHACKALAKASFVPVVFDNLITGHKHAVKWGPYVHGDILEPHSIRAAIEQFKPIAIMHFGAFASVAESVKNPYKYYTNNVTGTLALLNEIKAYRKIPFIFSSSAAVYGIPKETPIKETSLKLPVNPYGKTKLIAEEMIKDFELPFASLRYFNAAGADLEGEIGEEHADETHLIPLILQTAWGHRDSISIFGTDYPTPDGTAIRDYIHVQDLAKAHVLSLIHLLEGKESLTLNLGTETGYSVKEVIQTAVDITSRNIPITYAPRREGDPDILVADCQKCKSVLGFTPKHSDLKTLIGSAWNWHQKNWTK